MLHSDPHGPGAAAQRVSVVRRWSVSVQIGWRLASGFFDRVERRKTGEQRVPVLQVGPDPAYKLPCWMLHLEQP